ncbi:hypothetical protein FDJ25_gp148 [Vibrio phage Aphrodite1]|uniref:Virion structural protein n=1 Tax=Vibrio phage Aphrodite1 TaxID=2070057 RepID=A0A2I7QHT8_9CAUD|nr:hypothetical protein FDJ25_gp148 [Vibrio phage Aphrodite1]AUR80967.1 hypothetical protein Aphrodite1_0053 [Vibrio phage Aphrodite1]
MYLYRRCIGAYQGDLAGLQPLKIENAKLSSVMEKTRALFITVYDALLLKEITVDMGEYRSEALYFHGSIQDWLDTKERIPLKVYLGKIGETYNYVRMEDMQQAGYVVLPGRLDFAAGRQPQITNAGAVDLKLKHIVSANPNYQEFVKTTLFTYNGYFIRGVGRPDGIYLVGGGRNFRIDDKGHVGALDFKGISSIETVPFEKEQLDIDGKSHSVLITVDRPILEETVWLVIGGKLICGDPAVTKVGKHSFRLDLRALDLGRLLVKGAKHIDLDNVANCRSGVVEAELLERSDVIEELLLNFNSFIIYMSNPYMGVDVEPLETYTFPTTFATEDQFHHPVMLSDGRFPTYRHRLGAGRRLLDFDVRYIDISTDYSTGSENGGGLFHDKVNWYEPHHSVEAYHFKIYSIFKDM